MKVYAKSAIPEHLQQFFVPAEYGLEKSPAKYVETMRAVFGEVRRVLADDGTLWLNIGDSYNAYNGNRGRSATGMSRHDPLPVLPSGYGLTTSDLAPKNMLGIPWQVAFALQADGWILRNAVIWHKPNAMPESVTDRLSCTYEHVFLMAKQPRYWFDLDAIKAPASGKAAGAKLETVAAYGAATGTEIGRRRWGTNPASTLHTVAHQSRNPGDVWTIPTSPFPAAHFAVMAPALAERCVRAGCKPGGTVLDPFCGVGTTGMVAGRHGRRFVGVDISASTLDLALRTRLRQGALIEDVPS